jgi:hypothetical protein
MSDETKKTREVRFTTEAEMWKYLGWLARHTLLGETESDVAHHILRQRLTEMRREDYKDPDKT